MKIDLKEIGLSKLNDDLHHLSPKFISARQEALRRTGANYRRYLILDIFSGVGWGGLHPTTVRLKGISKRFGTHAIKRFKLVSDTPHRILGKLARYAVQKDTLHIFFGSGILGKGKFGESEPGIKRMVERIQSGKTWTITPKMRRYLAANGVPVKKGVTSLKTRPRPIIPMFFAKNKDKMVQTYKDKFEQIIVKKLSR